MCTLLNRDPGRAEVPAVFESSKKSKFRSKIRKFEKKGTPNGTIVQHDPKATDDAHERAAHVYQNVSVHMDSGSCPQGEVFWPNYHKKVLAVDHPVPARAHARQSPGRAGLQVYFGHTSFWRRNLYVKKLRAVEIQPCRGQAFK